MSDRTEAELYVERLQALGLDHARVRVHAQAPEGDPAALPRGSTVADRLTDAELDNMAAHVAQARKAYWRRSSDRGRVLMTANAEQVAALVAEVRERRAAMTLTDAERATYNFAKRCAESRYTDPTPLQPFMLEKVVAIIDRITEEGDDE